MRGPARRHVLQRSGAAEAKSKVRALVPPVWVAASVVLVLCLAAPPLVSGDIGLGINIGFDFPSGDATLDPGGIWHLALDYSPNERLSVAAEVGTAANTMDGNRTIPVNGIPRAVSLHAVSTLGLVGRYALRGQSPSPYLLLGADYYSSWDDLRETPQTSGTVTRTGLGLPVGSGIMLRAHSRWDFYGEGFYHFALGSDDDARFAAIQFGIRYRLGRRPSG